MFIALKCCLGITALLNFVVEVPKHSDRAKVNSNKDPGLHQNVEYCVVELKDISVFFLNSRTVKGKFLNSLITSLYSDLCCFGYYVDTKSQNLSKCLLGSFFSKFVLIHRTYKKAFFVYFGL